MYKVIENALTPSIYENLREKVNFHKYNEEDVSIALKQTLYSIVVYDNDHPIGIGRIVGDDRIVFFIKDVVVDPDYQKNNIGRLIMESLLDYIKKKGCPSAYIGLMSTPNTEFFYEKFEFVKRPTESFGHGMVRYNA